MRPAVQCQMLAATWLVVLCACLRVAHGADITLEAHLSQSDAYVGETVHYIVRLTRKAPLRDLQMGWPRTPEHARMAPLGLRSDRTLARGGEQYLISEWRFALTPDTSAQVRLDGARLAAMTPAAGSTTGGFAPVFRSGPAVVLDVRPAPVPLARWLPARDLKLTHAWHGTDDLLLPNDLVAVTFEVTARSIRGDDIPPVKLTPVDGVTFHYDAVQTRTETNRDGLRGHAMQRVVMVLNRPGSYQLGALELPWWNLSADAAAKVSVPAREVRVQALSVPKVTPATAGFGAVVWSAVGSLILTAVLLGISGRHLLRHRIVQLRLRARLLKACDSHDAPRARLAWHAWRQRVGFDSDRDSTDADHRGVSGRWSDDAHLPVELRLAKRGLDAALFSLARVDWDGTQLARAVRKYCR